MSCFVRVATRIVDETALRDAVGEAGYRVSESKTVRGWSENTETADLVIDLGSSYDVGAVRTADGTFEFVADWEMARLDKDAFVGKMTQAYGVARVTQAAKKAGFTVASRKVDEKGAVKMTLRRFV